MSIPFYSTLLLTSLLASACTPDTEQVTLAVSADGPGPAIADHLEQLFTDRGIAIDVRQIESTADIIATVQAGTIDFGIIEEPPEIVAGVATVAPLFSSLLHVLYKSEEVTDDFAEALIGKSVYAGLPNGAASQFLAELSAYFGIDTSKYTTLDNPWVQVPDVYFVFGGLLALNELRDFAGYRFFSFGDADQPGNSTVADGIALRFPNINVFVLPERVYGSLNPSPVLTVATRTVLITRTSADVQMVYDVASSLFENSQQLSSDYPLASGELSENIDFSSFVLPAHSGVRRYLDRDAPTAIERYAEVAGLGLTLFAMFISALFAVHNLRKTHKKNRIDIYYNKILDLRRRLQNPDGFVQRHQIEKEVRDVQEEVFRLLVDERVSANESLTIFLDLSNQVLAEVQSGVTDWVDTNLESPSCAEKTDSA